MPKMKSHSGAKKRFNVTANGKVKIAHPGKSHILTKKDRKRKRALRTTGYLSPSFAATIKNSLIPYKS